MMTESSLEDLALRGRTGPHLSIAELVSQSAIFLGIISACAVFAVLSPAFLASTNLFNVIRVMSIDGMLALGMTFVILGRGIDLSVGSTLALSGAAAVLTVPKIGLVGGVIAGLATGTLVGLVNGVVITVLSLQPFVATLATMVIVRGLAFITTGGYPILINSPHFEFLGNGYVGPVPVPIFVFVGAIALSYVLLHHTKLGPQIYALGGNPEAARRFGVNTSFVTIVSFMLCGLLAATGGVILAGRLSSVSPNAGTGYELDAIAAVVIGGTSLMGGRGKILGTIGGVAIIAIMNNGLDLLNIDPNYQLIVKGCIILFAVSIDSYLHKQRR
jgi:ribose transport system permease protein